MRFEIMLAKIRGREKRHKRLRKRVVGLPTRPRLTVYRSARHVYAQVIDDLAHRTLVSASDVEVEVRERVKGTKKRDCAKEVGSEIARKCLAKGINKVVFDRAGYQYHGRISALANGARDGGLQF